MDLGIKGRVALLTGASRGLGYACAEALADEGVRVAICGRDPDRIEAAARQISDASYFEKNGKTRKNKPRLNLPVQILMLDKDKKVITKDISSVEDLRLLWQYCKGNRNKGNGDRKG